MVFKYRCLAIIAPLVFLSDQLTKWCVVNNIPYGTGITVIPGYFDLVHVKNTGAAFGMMAGGDSLWRNPFFYAISAIATVVIVRFIRKAGPEERLMPVTLSLIMGGVFGNLLDRIRLGAVTDFLSVHWHHHLVEWALFGWRIRFPLEWPAFNVADSAITVSMVLLAWHIMQTPEPSQR